MPRTHWDQRSTYLTFVAVEDMTTRLERLTSMNTRSPNRSGLFRSVLNACIASRQRQADQYMTGALLMLDDETLKANGFTRETLAKRKSAYYL